MAKQTVKDYWTERITGHFDRLIEEVASKEPDLQSRVSKEARQKAIKALGLTDLEAAAARLLGEVEKAKAKLAKVQSEVYAKVRGTPPPKEISSWALDDAVKTAIGRREKVEEEALLAKNPVGKEIATLKDRKRQFLDRLWLTTTAKQINELWSEIEGVQ